MYYIHYFPVRNDIIHLCWNTLYPKNLRSSSHNVLDTKVAQKWPKTEDKMRFLATNSFSFSPWYDTSLWRVLHVGGSIIRCSNIWTQLILQIRAKGIMSSIKILSNLLSNQIQSYQIDRYRCTYCFFFNSIYVVIQNI